jgi:hypothetical protein
MVFREWMLSMAPKWMLNGYIKYGERIANFISGKTTLKGWIKRWMDTKVKQVRSAKAICGYGA